MTASEIKREHDKIQTRSGDIVMDDIIKYWRTPHLEGSNLQFGDSPDRVRISDIKRDYPNATWVIEEKLDGANSATSLSPETYEVRAQSRGHYLTGGPREFQFAKLKEWCAFFAGEITNLLEDRYVAFHEWTYAMHTQFYDALPHFLHEFDVYDKVTGKSMSTAKRREFLDGSPYLSVPVLYEGPAPDDWKHLAAMVRPSVYRTTGWRDNLAVAADRSGVGRDVALSRAGDDDAAEGLYVKIEDDDETLARFKWVNHKFVQTILDNDNHWSSQRLIRNELAPGFDVFSVPNRERAASGPETI